MSATASSHREAWVELGSERFRVRAAVTAGEARQRPFDRHTAQMPIFAEYQQKTTRQIPVLVFMRIDCAPCSVRAELAGTGVMVTFTSWQDILRADIGICSKSTRVLDI